MSAVRTNTLANAAGSKSVPVDTVVDGSAKAWVNFNGTGTVAIRASFNVSSITDNGVGDYTVNFASAMSDANFAVAGCAVGTASLFCTVSAAAGNVRVTTRNSTNSSAADISEIYAAVFR